MPSPFRASIPETLRRRLLPSLVLVLLALGGNATAATPKELAKVEFEKAQIEYKLGHFKDALDGYSRAYELFPAPAFLFNIGQCHKNLKEYDRAIFFFEGYLHDEKNAARRKLAEELLAESRTELKKQTPRTPAPAEATPVPAAPAQNAPAPIVAPPVLALPPPSPQPAEPVLVRSAAVTDGGGMQATPNEPTPLTHRWWFWTAIGAGVLAAAGSVAYWELGRTTAVPPGGSIGTLDRR